MFEKLILGLGFVALVEGLVLALAFSHFKEMSKMLSELSSEMRKWIGLGCATLGAILIWSVS